MTVKAYTTNARKIPGTTYSEVYKRAFSFYKDIKRHTKRRPYVRSAYFKKEKIFLGLFWQHLHEKLSLKDKTRRAKYFVCAIDLITNSKITPITKQDPNSSSDLLHRFTGNTPENELFFVQIKQDKNTGQKYLISVFPSEF